jgi:hypothetical protein
MITRTFKAKEDPELGNVGWMPTWITDANSGDARLAAHDILEHYVDSKGGAEGELMAMGCVIWGRANAGSLYNPYRSVENTLGSDIMFVLREVVYGNQTLTNPGRTASLEDVDDSVESLINDCIPEALKSLRSEMECEEQNYNQAIGLTDAEITYRLRGWLRKGARQAENRYYKCHGVGSGDLSMMFDKVQEKVARYSAEDYLGCELKVSVDLRKFEVKCRVIEPDFY